MRALNWLVVVGAFCGTIAPPLFALTVLALTIAERSFLSESGWSAIHRTPVEWPSLLALGSAGVLMEGAFIICGGLLVVFGVAISASARDHRIRFSGGAIATAGVAVALEAFKADAPGVAMTSWHAAIHNAGYPVIPVAAIAAAVALSFRAPGSEWHLTTRWSPVAFVVFAAAVVGTNINGVAQLSRYFLFAAMLAWLELLAVDALRAALPRRARRPR